MLIKQMFLYSVCFAVLLFVVGCKADNTEYAPKQHDAQSAQEDHVQVEPVTEPKDNETIERPSEPEDNGTIPMKGEIVEDHTFVVQFESLGHVDFVSTRELSANAFPIYHFYITRDTDITKLEYETSAGYAELEAIAFRDVNQDGAKDIITVMNYTTGIGYMGAIPYSNVIVFTQHKNGFEYDEQISHSIVTANVYRQITVDQIMDIVRSGYQSNAGKAWESLKPGTYYLDGYSDWGGSEIEIIQSSAEGVTFQLDAFTVRGGEEGLKAGSVNVGNIGPSIAVPVYNEMIYEDDDFELSISLISPDTMYVRDNGESYFGYGVYVNGMYHTTE